MHAFAREYAARAFVGRAAELARLDEFWARARVQGGRLLLCAEAGRGKSALLYQWAVAREACGDAVAWVPVSLRFETARGVAVARALTDRLAALRGAAGHWTTLAAGATPGAPVLVVIDGVDEGLDGELLDELRALQRPPGLGLVVSARERVDRDARGWTAQLGWQAAAEVLALPPLGRAEVGALLGGRVQGDALTRVLEDTGGDPLLVALQAEGHLGSGLAGVFAAWWTQQEQAWAATGVALGALTEQLLAVLACAAGPLDDRALSALVGEGEADTLQRALAPLGRFVVRSSGGVVLAHPRLGAFFAERLTAERRAEVEARFVALGLAAEARWRGQQVAPPAYFVRWLATHLGRAGAAGEAALLALPGPEWAAAHRRLEGDAGFRDDLAAAWRVARARTQRAAPGAERAAALADELAMQLHQLVIDGQEVAIDDELRPALLSHGVRSERDTLRGLGALDGWEHRQAVAAVLPALSDDGVRTLCASATPGTSRQWPLWAIAERLLALGDTVEAAAWVAGQRAGATSVEVLGLAIGRLPQPWRGELQQQLLALPYSEAAEHEQELLEDRVQRSRHVEPDDARRLLDEADAMLSAVPDAELYWDDWYGSTDPRLELARAWALLGQRSGDAGCGERAGAWLARAAGWPYPFATVAREAQRPGAPWAEAVVEVAAACGGVPAAAQPALQRLQAETPPAVVVGPPDPARDLSCQLRLVPLLAPAQREAAWADLLSAALARPTLTTTLRELAERDDAGAVAQASARAWGERVLELVRSHDAHSGVTERYPFWYELSQRVLGALPALAPRLPADLVRPLATALVGWVEGHGPESHRRLRLGSPWSVAMLSHLLRRDAELARSTLDGWLARVEVPIWRCAGWEEVVPGAARQARLQRELEARPRLLEPSLWVRRLGALLDAAEGAREELVEVTLEVARRGSLELLAQVTRRAAPGRQAALVEELLARLPEQLDARNHLLRELVPGLAEPALRLRLARLMTEVPEGKQLGSSPWWMAVAAAELPEAEWDQRLSALRQRGALEAGALGQPGSLPPRMRDELIAARRPPPDQHLELAQWLASFQSFLPEAERAAVVAALTAWLLEVLPGAGDARRDASVCEAPPWQCLASLVYALTSAEVVPLLPALLHRAPETVRDVALYRLEPGLARTVLAGQREHVDDLLWFKLELAWLEPGQPLAPLFADLDEAVWSYPWVLDAVRRLGRATEYVRLAQRLPGSPRLMVSGALWADLPGAVQAELAPGLAAAASAEVASNQAQETGRLHALAALPDAAVLALWARDGDPARRAVASQVSSFPLAYVRRLGSVEVVQARIARELRRWL